LHACLLQAGASLDGHTSSVEQAAVLCTAVFDGDLPLLRRLIAAGVAVDSGDYGELCGLVGVDERALGGGWVAARLGHPLGSWGNT
jgi:hypothetical protein